MENKETFNYTYSAKEQKEIREIRNKYTPPPESEDKLTQLRRLDTSVVRKASAFAIATGVVGALVLGFGMSLAMTDIGVHVGLSHAVSMALGITVGVIGIAVVGTAYPIYNAVTKNERQKIAPEIIRLTDELMK